ncbi:predicted protein [Naegleria gruberi]|uniref:Predicted protein n=1 Tax=Naegleria gruberi TaxID=5762 RepID=D2VTS8_NAEGR|nr:uncharacterized protein NAEGRDRAFT_72411 [Naegleria gruberi]EFC39779.1 predicted protein [Naegleria gruberi]|eukprot:XP_002672523.1 predicted protein [Naegleria gruberi strain NEG-M]
MIFYLLPTSLLSQKLKWDDFKEGQIDFIQSFPFQYQNEEVRVCCSEPFGKKIVDVNVKKMIREYNIPALREIGCIVSSLSTLWVMDRWSRKIYTITDDEQPKEMEIGKKFNEALRAVEIATYTDHAIILMEDVKTGETYLFGHGSKELQRFKDDADLSQPIFIPHKELKPSSRITHISCCFSYSVCVIDNRDIHICGQNWNSSSSNATPHNWSNLVYRCPEDVISLKSGNFFFIAVLKDGRIVSGGSNGYNETTQPRTVKDVCVNDNLGFPVVSVGLGSCLSVLKSKSGNYHIFGRTKSKYGTERQLKESLCVEEDRSRTIPYDEVFVERDVEVMHYKDNSMLMIMNDSPCLIRYSQIPTPNCQFQVLPQGIVFYSKGAQVLQQLLHSALNRPKSRFISDISITVTC